ncbi:MULTISPECIES: hypothetical protein [unclassified Janthinobacterium]|uniref:hypothetical protein n=1 Tax=unclassified Janthinobacterium TaxID=2610881 RepID=UPI00111319D2|nr:MULTISPECIES: hypothetical protein [unclassified Janthinobacterium]
MKFSNKNLFLGFFLACAICPAGASPLNDRLLFWEKEALMCPAEPGRNAFPTKQTGDPAQPCDDGDMTLFNGLLCAAGDPRGCQGVAEAQNPATGEWARSPRIRILGRNDRGDAFFSPDMALGLQLYFVKTGDVAAARKWLTWMHEHVACSVELFNKCLVRALPRFCTNDEKDKGCTMRPGDAAQLSATVSYLQQKYGMQDLPDGRLRGYLGTFSGYGQAIVDIDAHVNDAGFPMHLVGVSVMLMRMMGQTDPRIATAAATLARREPRNAFFRYLSEGKTPAVIGLTTEKCPALDRQPTPPLIQWQWERAEADRAWEHSSYWDCIFMAHLLR